MSRNMRRQYSTQILKNYLHISCHILMKPILEAVLVCSVIDARSMTTKCRSHVACDLKLLEGRGNMLTDLDEVQGKTNKELKCHPS